MVSLSSDWNDGYYNRYAGKVCQHNRNLIVEFDEKFGDKEAEKLSLRLFLPDPNENEQTGYTSKIIGSIPQPAHNFLLSYVLEYALYGRERANIKILEIFYGVVREQETTEVFGQRGKLYQMDNKPFTQDDLFKTITNALRPLNVSFVPPTHKNEIPQKQEDDFELGTPYWDSHSPDDQDSGFFFDDTGASSPS